MLYASAIGRQHLGGTDVHTSQKDKRISIFSLLSAIASKTTDDELMRLARDVEETPEAIGQWIEGNLYLIADAVALPAAYQHLARADEYLGYTFRRQYHTLWRYATALMVLGVADAAAGKGIHAKIMPPARWQKMSAAKKQKAIRFALLAGVAAMMHIPQSTLREQYLSTLTLLVEHDPVTFARDLSLDAESLNFFLNDRAKSQEVVRKIVREAKEQERRKEEQAKAKKQKPKEPEATEPPPVTPESAEKRQQQKDQSTLFDGFK
jgi:replication factor C large subunit